MRQARLLILAFSINIALGLIDIILLSIPNPVISCETDGISYLVANNAVGTVTLYVKDFAQLVPHVFIPYILYVLPVASISRETILKVYFTPT